MTLMQFTDRQQRVDSFLPVLADPDENTGRKWNAEPARLFDCSQPDQGFFIRRIVMGAARQQQSLAHALQHEPQAGIDFSEALQVSPAHDTGI
jgi:hypothetical protein